MIPETNPATPAQAATPGAAEPGKQNPTPPTNTPPAAPTVEEGKVTISTKEYADLQRQKARAISLQKRQDLNRGRAPGNDPALDPNDPRDAELIELRRQNQETNARLRREEAVRKTSELLSKPEYKDLPESTKRAILKNPSSLSDAETVDEMLLDIEEFVSAELAPLHVKADPAKPGPANVETPPSPGGGAPTPPSSNVEEDVSKLPPSERAAAVLRNKFRKGGIQVR